MIRAWAPQQALPTAPSERAVVDIRVPTINDGLPDFDALFAIGIAATGPNAGRVRFDFTDCRFLRQSAVAFLGALARLVELNGGVATFDLPTIQEDVRANLAQNGFLAARGFSSTPWAGNSVKYREDTSKDHRSIMAYLKQDWLCWLNLSPDLRAAVAGRVWEMYENAFEHSGSRIGVVSCGQHYPNLGLLKLTVLDMGVGIPNNVRSFHRLPALTSDRALEWAFQQGATTKPGPGGRGLGLDLLREFVRVNRGRLEVFSDDGYALIDAESQRFVRRARGFSGTLLNISLHCDPTYYHLSSELPGRPIF